MRFFTPELYGRFNSPDDAVADAAYQEWEAAIERYAGVVSAIREVLPSQAKKLTELSLHDSLILSRREEIQAGGMPFYTDIRYHEQFFPLFLLNRWTAIYVVTVKDEDVVRSLIYCLRDGVQVRTHQEWPFSKEGEHWLYDELDVNHSDRWPIPLWFTHRILLSSGVELEIPFTTLFIHEYSLAKINQEVAE